MPFDGGRLLRWLRWWWLGRREPRSLTWDDGARLRGSFLLRMRQRRERGNVALYLGKRRGRYNATGRGIL